MGVLVRYKETTRRWYRARVERVKDSSVDLTFLESPPTTVDRQCLQRADVFLGQRRKVLSVTRSKLTELFYRKPLEPVKK